MSTKKTTNLNLHQWEPDDAFLRAEFNENFAALDALPLRSPCVFGSYVGDGTDGRDIELGFRPSMLLVLWKESGTNPATIMTVCWGTVGVLLKGNYGNNIFQNMAGTLALTETGFRIVEGYYHNIPGQTIHYAAIR